MSKFIDAIRAYMAGEYTTKYQTIKIHTKEQLIQPCEPKRVHTIIAEWFIQVICEPEELPEKLNTFKDMVRNDLYGDHIEKLHHLRAALYGRNLDEAERLVEELMMDMRGDS